jgi:two-component system, chemotaxis family, protein-glutamate methylesterase/glutaminase
MSDGAGVQAVAVGASAGALEALSAILPALPENYPLPILIVVHVPPDKDSLLTTILATKCSMKVHEAEDKQAIEAGAIYVAPPGYHLLVEKDRTLSLSTEEEVHFSRPSIDVLFETAADAYGARLAGIVLTGANDDGAGGLRAIADAGGVAVVQQPEMAFSPFMPQAALKACPSARVMSLAMIATWLKSLAEGSAKQ